MIRDTDCEERLKKSTLFVEAVCSVVVPLTTRQRDEEATYQ
jgi:hypothetical protein